MRKKGALNDVSSQVIFIYIALLNINCVKALNIDEEMIITKLITVFQIETCRQAGELW